MKIAKIAFLVIVLLAMATIVTAQGDSTPGNFAIPFSSEILARVAVSIFLSTVAEFLVSGLVTPIFDKFNVDKFWLRYVAWVIAGGIVAMSAMNLFESYIPNRIAGQALTAVFCGGGSNKIHDFFDRYVSKRKVNE